MSGYVLDLLEDLDKAFDPPRFGKKCDYYECRSWCQCGALPVVEKLLNWLEYEESKV